MKLKLTNAIKNENFERDMNVWFEKKLREFRYL